MKLCSNARVVAVLCMCIWFIVTPVIADENQNELPNVDGVIGFYNGDDGAFIAVRVDYPDSLALTGVSWYNNDSSVEFPSVSVGTGYARSPGSHAEMTVIAQQVSGGSSEWSTVEFSQPIAASHNGVYVVFEVPVDAAFTGLGVGGGVAFGFCSADIGVSGWMSPDGFSWIKLRPQAGFAVLPILVPLEPGMLVKRLGSDDETVIPELLKPYLVVGPNPFNPRTDLRFGLPQEARVKLDILDVRGRRLTRLVDGVTAAGPHVVPWTGVDDRGRTLASGVYFVRLQFGREVLVDKLTLLR